MAMLLGWQACEAEKRMNQIVIDYEILILIAYGYDTVDVLKAVLASYIEPVWNGHLKIDKGLKNKW